MSTEPESAETVAASMRPGNGLALTATAESIEASTDKAHLTAPGYQQGQGFQSSHAVGAAKIAPLLKAEALRDAVLASISRLSYRQ